VPLPCLRLRPAAGAGRAGYLIRRYGFLADLESRLQEAWRAKAVRYNNVLLKDFCGVPEWFQSLAASLEWAEQMLNLKGQYRCESKASSSGKVLEILAG
jgi:hypothetical protein